MTEEQWLEGNAVQTMLAHVGAKASERKLRLFACACVRELGHLLTSECARKAFFVAERFADGTASVEELAAAHALAAAADRRLVNAQSARIELGERVYSKVSAVHVALTELTRPHEPVRLAQLIAGNHLLCHAGDAAWRGEVSRLVCEQLREVFGNPFRRLRLSSAWRRGQGRDAIKVAAAIHAERAFDEMGVLADALEEAGGPVERLIEHCRTGSNHGRGCWAVEARMVKER